MWTVYLINGQQISQDKCEWNLLPRVPIMKMSYRLANEKYIVLQGFEAYFQLKEGYKFLYGARGQLTNTINLFGKNGNKVYQFSIHRKGKSAQIINEWGQEFRPLIIKTLPKRNRTEKKRFTLEFGKPQKTNHALWKCGVKLPKVKVSIEKTNPNV